eukprot:COSAG02_NODE_2463_length_8788_cov_3.119001_5_plen_115_part_00
MTPAAGLSSGTRVLYRVHSRYSCIGLGTTGMTSEFLLGISTRESTRCTIYSTCRYPCTVHTVLSTGTVLLDELESTRSSTEYVLLNIHSTAVPVLLLRSPLNRAYCARLGMTGN